MRRLLALGCVLALGCAGPPGGRSADLDPRRDAVIATPPVDAGPPGCEALAARIHSSQEQLGSDAHTWLDAPDRMVESRRLRALEARASQLGCGLPQG